MTDEIAFDTSSLEDIDAGAITVSKQVMDEVEGRGLDKGLVDGVESTDSSLKCVNDNIQDDIQKLSKRLGRNERKEIRDDLVEAGKQRSEDNRQVFLNKAWDKLEARNRDVKSWQGEVAGAKTDCSVLSLGREKGALASADKSILRQCEEEDDLKCIAVASSDKIDL